MPARDRDPLQLVAVGGVVAAHRGGVTGRDPSPQSGAHRVRGKHLDETRLLVVDLVTVHVDEQSCLQRGRDRYLKGTDPIVAGVLEMRDRADRVDASARGLRDQFLAVGERDDAFLRKRHELEVDDVTHALSDLDQCIQRDERRVGGVDVTAHVQDSVGDLPAQHLVDPGDNVIVGERRLALGPARDALPQGAALVPPWLTRGQAGVHMHVRLDVRRAEHGPFHVDLLGHVVDPDSSPLQRGKTTLIDQQVDQPFGKSAGRGQPAISNNKLHQTATSFGAGL